MFQFPIVSENGFNQVAQQLAVFASPCCVAVSKLEPLMLHFWLSKHPRINETSATSCRVWGLGLRCRSTKSPELQVHSVYTVTWSTNRDDMLNASQEYKIQRYTVCSMTQHECVPSSWPFFCWTLWLWQVPHLWFRISWRQLKFCRMRRLGSEHMSTILRDTRYNHAGLKIWT